MATQMRFAQCYARLHACAFFAMDCVIIAVIQYYYDAQPMISRPGAAEGTVQQAAVATSVARFDSGDFDHELLHASSGGTLRLLASIMISKAMSI